ncbi:YDG domain-containing protein [Laedolimicola intestinihominis]|uniref:YDG domain-containing protein n=1 Tax=Laedolimicola intestinihominis TaxID=3133166 RepID=A0ABV1FC85_9FIRM
MRKHLRGNRGTRWLAILLTAAMVVGSVDTTVLAEAAKGAEEQTLPVAEAGTSGDAKDKEETPVVKTETSEEGKNPEAAENAQSGKDANAPETSGNAEKTGADENSTSENGAGGVLSELQEAPLEVEFPTETIELESEFSEEWDNDELFEGYAWKQLYGDEGIATYGTVARSHLSEEEKAAYDVLKDWIREIACNGGNARFYGEITISGYIENPKSSTVLGKIWDALKTDCPYELYWWDGGSLGWHTEGGMDENGKYYIKVTQIDIGIASDYQGDTNIYVDAKKAQAVDTAVAKAKEIVEGLKDDSVYERLNGYKNAIKDLASYNAKLNDSDYVQQLINVFDEDPSTATGYEGYARAFQYLCDLDAGGIKCYTVKGTMQYARHTDSGPFTHQNMTWNIVRLRRKNYLVDVVTCDSNGIAGAIGYEDGKDKLFLAGAKKTDSGNYRKEFNNPNDYVWYSYNGATKKAYTEAELNISSEDYDDSEPLPIKNATITIAAGTDVHEDETFTYDAQNHDVVVTLGEDELEPEYDYTLTITKDGAAYAGAIRNAGIYEITVTGSGGYTGSVEKTVTIEKRPVTPSIIERAEYLTKAYDGTTGAYPKLNYDGECQEWMTHYIRAEYEDANVGTGKKITVKVRLDGEIANNYYLTTDTLTTDKGVITKGDPTLIFRYGGGAYATTYTYSGEPLRNPEGNELILTNVNTGVQIITHNDLIFTWFKGTDENGTELEGNPVDAGTYYLKVSVAETENYNAASAGTTITIEPKKVENPEITVTPDSYEYDGKEKQPTVTVKDGETIIPSTEYTVSYSDNKNVGTATVTISNTEGGNYEVSGNHSRTFTITKVDSAKLTVVKPKVSGVYGTKTGELAIAGGKVTTADGKEISGNWAVTDTASHDMDKLLPVEGTETCTLTFTPEDTNYPNLTAEVTPNITARSVKVQINSVSRAYKAENPTFTWRAVTEEGFLAPVENDNLGIDLTTNADSNSSVGQYDITGTASNQNYDVTIAGGKKALTITKAAAPEPTRVEKSYIYASVPKYLVSIYLSKAMNLPADCGEVTYTSGETTGDMSILTRTAVYNSTFEYGLRDDLTADKIGAKVVVKVSVQMENYEDTYYELTIQIVDKKDITGSASAKNSIRYGQTLKDVELAGTFTDAENTDITLAGTFTILNGDNMPSAGTAEVRWTFTPTDKKYKPVNGTTNITVEKATPERAAAPTAAELTYGQTLAESTLTGGKAVNPNTQEAVAGTWSWADDTVKPTVDNQGYQVVFTPEDTANYNRIEATVGVTVKKAVPTISEAPTASDLTYGQTLSESTLTGGAADTDGTFIWAKADTRPEVKDSNVTEYEAVFTPTDTVNWENAAAQAKVKVSPKILTWDGSALTVLTKLADEMKDASLIGELKVSGLLDGDDAGLSYESLTAEFDTAEAGTDKQVTVTIAGAALTNANYELPAETAFTLKGSIEKTAALPGQTGLGNEYRLVMGAKDVTEVTPDLAKTENLNTPEKIVEYLKKLLVDCKIDGKNPAKENTAVYDAVLLYSADGGETWIRATADNFPAEGVKVILPYPEGTNAADYRFSAVHMFAMNRGAYKAGDVETPELTLTKDGITMTLKSLSPIALSWVKVEKAPETKPGDHSGSSSGSGNKSGGSAVTSAATGDSSQPVFWGAMALICLLGISMLLTAVRRKRGQRTE